VVKLHDRTNEYRRSAGFPKRLEGTGPSGANPVPPAESHESLN